MEPVGETSPPPVLTSFTREQERGTTLTSNEARIQTPQKNDVLCGRGKSFYLHPGNIYLRSVVAERKDEYCLAPMRERKGEIIRSIMAHIAALQPPGRFLERDEDNPLDNEESLTVIDDSWQGYWKEAGEAKAFAKISQTLRQGAPDIRRRAQRISNAGTPTNNPSTFATFSSGNRDLVSTIGGTRKGEKMRFGRMVGNECAASTHAQGHSDGILLHPSCSGANKRSTQVEKLSSQQLRSHAEKAVDYAKKRMRYDDHHTNYFQSITAQSTTIKPDIVSSHKPPGSMTSFLPPCSMTSHLDQDGTTVDSETKPLHKRIPTSSQAAHRAGYSTSTNPFNAASISTSGRSANDLEHDMTPPSHGDHPIGHQILEQEQAFPQMQDGLKLKIQDKFLPRLKEDELFSCGPMANRLRQTQLNSLSGLVLIRPMPANSLQQNLPQHTCIASSTKGALDSVIMPYLLLPAPLPSGPSAPTSPSPTVSAAAARLLGQHFSFFNTPSSPKTAELVAHFSGSQPNQGNLPQIVLPSSSILSADHLPHNSRAPASALTSKLAAVSSLFYQDVGAPALSIRAKSADPTLSPQINSESSAPDTATEYFLRSSLAQRIQFRSQKLGTSSLDVLQNNVIPVGSSANSLGQKLTQGLCIASPTKEALGSVLLPVPYLLLPVLSPSNSSASTSSS